ncbi:MAG TPA: ABC transporter ATP-binding protein [Pseudonocardiaceae bacterium]|nr:ABC transporter ATP-binding protein [Pseudonocardiaceae bacterium]
MTTAAQTHWAGPGESAAAAIEARSLYRFFRAGEEETLALRGVSLSVMPGEFVAVVGPSGSGKSTLLACLAGLDDPDGGSVLVEGLRMSHQPEPVRSRLRARRIGVLTQSGNLFDHLTVEGNLAVAQGLEGKSSRGSRMGLLGSVGLAQRAGALPSQLSGGEATRAGLAVALANDPAVVLADEPTGELDSATEATVLELLRGAAGRGVAVLVASHSPAVASAADRVMRLVDGQIG